ncbi:MAG: hypothetical protein ACOCZT_02340 [Halanaerobiales bacterium]
MRKKYGIFIIILIFVLSGLLVKIISQYYSFEYLYKNFIKREFSINPRVEILPEKDYKIRIWYYPFFRNIVNNDEKIFFEKLQFRLQQTYPNIKIIVGKLNYRDGQQRLIKSLNKGNPPDIYLNMTENIRIDHQYSVSVEPYLSREKKKDFNIVGSDLKTYHSWPFLVHRMGIIFNEKHYPPDENQNLFELIDGMKKEKVVFNTADEKLLKILLTLEGITELSCVDGKLDEEFYKNLHEIFQWLYLLKKDRKYTGNSVEMDDKFLKYFLEEKAFLMLPVNIYLENYLLKKDYKKYNIENLAKIYKMDIYRQQDYKGDDHTRAVMEVARIISEVQADELAKQLSLETAFKNKKVGQQEKSKVKPLISIKPENLDYWQNKILPAWSAFWEEGLTPEEVMKQFGQKAGN